MFISHKQPPFMASIEIRGCSIRLSVPTALLLICIVKGFWPHVIPFDVFQFWSFHGALLNILADVWPVLVAGLVITIIASLYKFDDMWEVLDAHPLRFLVVALAGVVEEPVFRWIFFYSAIALLTIINWLFFGFAGFGVPQWLFLHVLGPAADFVTLHKLHPYLFDARYTWVVGAAILSANGHFWEGHAYQGWLGWLWSWFFGMFMFLVMFKYGLLAAMLVHVAYNSFICGVWLLIGYVSYKLW